MEKSVSVGQREEEVVLLSRSDSSGKRGREEGGVRKKVLGLSARREAERGSSRRGSVQAKGVSVTLTVSTAVPYVAAEA